MGDGSYLCLVRHTEIHAPVRRRHCIIHFQQSVRFVAVYLRDQRRGLSARHYRANDSRSSRCRCIYPDSIGTRLIDGNWYVCDYVVVFLLDTRCRDMERIHGPHSVEPHRGILVQGCRPPLCLHRFVLGIAAEESRVASVALMSRRRRSDCRSAMYPWARSLMPRAPSHTRGCALSAEVGFTRLRPPSSTEVGFTRLQPPSSTEVGSTRLRRPPSAEFGQARVRVRREGSSVLGEGSLHKPSSEAALTLPISLRRWQAPLSPHRVSIPAVRSKRRRCSEA